MRHPTIIDYRNRWAAAAFLLEGHLLPVDPDTGHLRGLAVF